MNNQYTLTDMEYSNRKKKTKREEFFNAMYEICVHEVQRSGVRLFRAITFLTTK